MKGPDGRHSELYKHHHSEVGHLGHSSPETKEARLIRLSNRCLGGGEAGMPLGPHPTNQGTWKAVHSLGSWGPQGSWDSLASPPKVSHRPQGTSHSCRADTKGPLSQRGFPGSLGLTEPVALNLMPHQAPRHPGEKQLESKPAGYWRSSSDALSHGPSG